jgi:hypothetical protein
MLRKLPAVFALLVLTGCADPPLIQNLPNNAPVASEEFGRRIKQKFPDGCPEMEVVQELRRHGFRPRFGDSPSLRVYSFTKSGFLVESEWIVSWTAGPGHTVKDVAGTFGLTGP